MSGVEQPDRRHREYPQSVDAGLPHQREIAVHRRRLGELGPVATGRERAVSHPFDKMLLFPGEKKLAVHAEPTGPIGRCYRRRSGRNLVDFDGGHLGSSRGCAAVTLLGGGDARTTRVNEFHSPLRLAWSPGGGISSFPAKKARFRTTVQRVWARGPAGRSRSPPARCEVRGNGITGWAAWPSRG